MKYILKTYFLKIFKLRAIFYFKVKKVLCNNMLLIWYSFFSNNEPSILLKFEIKNKYIDLYTKSVVQNK